jgi:hypothetical protein
MSNENVEVSVVGSLCAGAVLGGVVALTAGFAIAYPFLDVSCFAIACAVMSGSLGGGIGGAVANSCKKEDSPHIIAGLLSGAFAGAASAFPFVTLLNVDLLAPYLLGTLGGLTGGLAGGSAARQISRLGIFCTDSCDDTFCSANDEEGPLIASHTVN